MIDASPVAAPDIKEVSDLLSACARMDIWGLSEVAKAWCGAASCYKNCAASTSIKSQGRPVCSCSRCAPGARRYRLCTVRKEMKSTTIKKKSEIDIQESFFPVLSFIHSHLFFKNFMQIINFLDLTFAKKNYLTNWSPSREKRIGIHRINTLVLPLLRQDYF